MLPLVIRVTAAVIICAAAVKASPMQRFDQQRYDVDLVPYMDMALPRPVVPKYNLASSRSARFATDHNSGAESLNTRIRESTASDGGERVVLPYGAFSGFTFSPFGDETQVRVHLGIPFAQAPIGNQRFLPPKPIVDHLGERSATSFGPSCIQTDPSVDVDDQSEDCLFVNVFAPANIPPGVKLPVMVWVYGGNFASGTASNPNYNGSTLVHTSSRLGQDVVVVTFNYRTGVFGFLASPEIQLAGGSNAGLRDQIAAFRWVRDHIDAFGGDPARVTAFGESAGSCSIATHLTGAHPPTASSPPLFDAAILQSAGVDFGYTFDWTTVYVTIHAAVASATQCADLACLQSLPASTLRTVQRALETSGTSFRPYVDGDYLPSTPRARLRAGTFMQVPVLVGTNTDEGTGFTTAVTRDQFDSLVTAAFPSLPQFLVAAIYANYPVADYATTRFGPDAAPFLAAADLIGDIGIQCPSQRVADAYARLSNATDPADGKPLVFRYRFNYLPSWIPESQAVGGVAHTYEIPFVFAASATMASASDTALAREMVSMWTFFAQSSGRNGMNGWLGQTVQWPKYQADPMLGAGGGRQVRIDGPGSYVVQLDTSRSAKCNFWNLLTAAISA